MGVLCSCGMVLDRDINASVNIARRGVGAVRRMSVSRSRSQSFTGGASERRSSDSPVVLRFPGRDRSKSGPTPKRSRSRSFRSVPRPVRRDDVDGGEKVMSPPCLVHIKKSRVHGDGETWMAPGLVISDSLMPACLARE